MLELIAIGIYFSILFSIVFFCRKRGLTQNDFVIGNRSMNRWMTALAAHASDMSNWLLMAYPGMIYLHGGRHLWAAFGLTLMMWLNWIWIAPKVREKTEKMGSNTLVDYLEKRLGGNWAIGRITTSCLLLLFYTVYISGALFGMGFLIESLFGLPYWVGVLGGVVVILPYVLIGGYLTLAQVDLFQGLFLLGVLLFVPLFVGREFGVSGVIQAIHNHGRSLNIFDGSLAGNIFLMLGWGMGYFGQPHIISKFMGIKHIEELRYSKRIGIGWLVLSLGAASLVGLVGIAYFGNDLKNPESVFIEMVRGSFPAFFSGLFLCAIIATVINSVSSMLLVLSTTLSEDFYLRFFRKKASSRESLIVSRLACVVVALLAMTIALAKFTTIDQLVFYAWSGLGASFGPLLIMALYSKRLTTSAAWAGMVAGGGTVAFWPLLGTSMPPLVVAFPFALITIWAVAKFSEKSVLSAAE